MTIKTKLTLLFLSVVSLLLSIFCGAIYFESEMYRQKEYKIRLRQEALAAATALFNNNLVSAELLKQIAKNNMTVLNQEKIEIFDNKNIRIYQNGNDSSRINLSILNTIRQKQELFWEENEIELYGMVFKHNAKNYIVFATAVDKYGIRKQKNLALMLLLGGFGMLIISVIAGSFIAGLLLLPIKKMIKKIDLISETKLSLRLNEGNKKDELAQLSIRFNEMLDRLQIAFKSQHAFVANASHELRTPLTAITGQIQVSLLANDTGPELKTMIHSILEDVQQLNKLTHNLLDLTSIEIGDTKLKVELVNIAVIIQHIKNELKLKQPNYIIKLDLNDGSDMIPQILANESLIYIGILNLIENGAKFSPKNTVNVSLKIYEKIVKVIIQNDEPIISENELQLIFEPFKRGINSKKTKGHGVGLSLVNRIVSLHNAKLTTESNVLVGTVFTLILPKKMNTIDL